MVQSEKTLLLVVDMQNGFITTKSMEDIIGPINHIVEAWHAKKWPVVFSRFINTPASPWVRFMGWNRLIKQDEISIRSEINTDNAQIFDKTKYSAWSDELLQVCTSNNINQILICGVETDQCVLATAISIFDAGIRPLVLKDCCASSADKLHNMGMELIERLIGPKQIVNTKDIL
jgi:nicotinamidase-related amidase